MFSLTAAQLNITIDPRRLEPYLPGIWKVTKRLQRLQPVKEMSRDKTVLVLDVSNPTRLGMINCLAVKCS